MGIMQNFIFQKDFHDLTFAYTSVSTIPFQRGPRGFKVEKKMRKTNLYGYIYVYNRKKKKKLKTANRFWSF